MEQKKKTPSMALIYGLLLFGMVASTFHAPLFRIGLNHNTGMTSENMSVYRMLFAFLGAAAVCLFQKDYRKQVVTIAKTPRTFCIIALMGIFNASSLLIWAYCLNSTTPIFVLNMISNTHPLFIMLGSYLMFRERTGPRAMVGVAICMVGVGIISISSFSGGAISLWAVIGMFGAAILSALYLLLGKFIQQDIAFWPMLSIIYLFSTLEMFACCLISGSPFGPINLEGWIIFVVMGLWCTLLGHSCGVWAVKYISAVRSSLFNLLGPVVSAVVCYVLLGEIPGILVLIGGCIVMAGLGVYNVAKIKEGEAAAERQR
ncbi:MAG: DMT family transporter [Clostridiales bacterium]|nr:DMT family transporter [Clostridiales bacterium]